MCCRKRDVLAKTLYFHGVFVISASRLMSNPTSYETVYPFISQLLHLMNDEKNALALRIE